jgi:hypothetical protein
MKEHIIKQLRECAAVYGKQQTWISELSDDQLYKVFLKIRGGESCASIARFCQQQWGVKPKSTIHSLKQGILKFQKRIAHLLVTVSGSPTVVDCSHNDSLVTHNCIESLEYDERIAAQLRRRIERMIKEESEAGFTQQNLGREILALTTLEKTIIKQREWFLRHPGEDPVEKKKELKRQESITNNFKGYIENSTAEGKEHLIEATSKFLEMCEQNAVTLEIDDDGNYSVLNPSSDCDK